MNLYHLTSKVNINSILSGGLKINARLNGSHGIGLIRHDLFKSHGLIPLFFTSNPDRLMLEQLTTEYIREYQVHCLTVDLAGFVLIDEYSHILNLPTNYFPYTWIIQHDISPDRIINIKKFH